ncbi:MAG: acyltransferase [Lachnospiraceae bacterium]|nr:acyltransferase [Lachnospiraceae bacterium]
MSNVASVEEVFANYPELENENLIYSSDKISSNKLSGNIFKKIFAHMKLKKYCTKFGENIQMGKFVDIKASDNAVLEIGNNAVLSDYCHLLLTKPNPHLYIGDNAYIGRGAIIAAKEEISIGAFSLIGQFSQISDTSHNFRRGNLIKYQKSTCKPVSIGYDCWIGAGVKIFAGITIGNGVIVGANAVVTKDLPDYAIAVGCPARIIGYRE